MSDYGDDEDPYKVDRGYKTDSYILAVQGNPILIQSIPLEDQPSTSQTDNNRLPQNRRHPKVNDPKASSREVYEAYIVDAGDNVDQRLIGRKAPPVETTTIYGSLNKNQLDRYRKDECWSTCRWILMLLILLLCIALLLFTFYIIYISPKCEKVDKGWWSNSVIYEVWTPSFRDSNADGFGDFDGIDEKLKYLRRFGIDTIYPRPFLKSESIIYRINGISSDYTKEMHDELNGSYDANGLAILDLEDVYEKNGALQSAINLIKSVHKQKMRIVIDFPVAVTSKNHEWFQRSAQASLPENSEFATHYFWKRNMENTEFISTFNGTENVYYHVEDHPEWPVLNYASPNVSKAIKNALNFWLDHGVDGFHLRFADYLSRTNDGKHPNWRGVVNALNDLKDHVAYYSNMSSNEELRDKRFFMFASMSHIGENDKIKLGDKAGLDGVLNSELLRIAVGNKICEKHPDSVADCANEVIGDILQFYTEEDRVWPLWQFGNAQTERLASRTSSRLHAELLIMVELLLPGTSVLYYGDELGVQDAIDTKFTQRTAMPWNSDSTSGFSNADLLKWSTKLPADWKVINFDNQYSDHRSHLRILKRIIQLRKIHIETLVNGKTYISKSYKNSFTLCRFNQKGNQTTGEVIVLAVNFGSRAIAVNLNDLPPYTVIYKQCGFLDTSVEFYAEIIAVSSAVIRQGTYYPHQQINIAPGTIQLGADQAIILKFNINPPSYFQKCPQ